MENNSSFIFNEPRFRTYNFSVTAGDFTMKILNGIDLATVILKHDTQKMKDQFFYIKQRVTTVISNCESSKQGNIDYFY